MNHGDHACAFFGRYLTHVKGEWAGQPLELQDWAYDDIIRPIFGTIRDGVRQYRRAYIEVPRKNAKSTIASGVALYMLLADNEPGAEVYSCAADREQARIVFDMAKGMVEASPELSKRCKVVRNAITVPATGSTYKALSADAFTKHGLNAHGVVFDELHAQKNRELWDVMATSMGSRRQPLMFAITTAGTYDPHSICWEIHDYAIKVRDGIIDDDTFLPVVYGADKEDDWTDPKVWAKANPGLGVTVKYEYLERECLRAKEIPAAQNTFRRLHLDQWTEQDTRWLDMDVWDANGAVFDIDGLHGRECYIGLDLANTIDIAAAACVFPPVEEGEKFKVRMLFWVPSDNILQRAKRDRVPYDVWAREGWITTTDGNVIDYSAIRRDINELPYQIREIAIDRWNATQLATQLGEDDGLNVFLMGQGFVSMAAPTKELERVLVGREMAHGGNPVLKWMASNVAVRQDPAGNLKPDKGKSTEKIDGIVALVMGLGRAALMLGPKVSKYETDDLLVL
jgi:phage terminase large subunit-like protein